MSKDIRWKQRFNNYVRAMRLLKDVISKKDTSQIEISQLATVKAYEMVVELGWNLLKDYMEHQGLDIQPNPKETVRVAFNRQLIADAQVWIDAIGNRNRSAHSYNEAVATELTNEINYKFLPAFEQLLDTFTKYYEEDAEDSGQQHE